MNLVALDVETGGLNYKGNPLLSVAAIPLDRTEPFVLRIRNTDKIITAKALEINGLDPTDGTTIDQAKYLYNLWLNQQKEPVTFLYWSKQIPGFDVNFIRENLGEGNLASHHIDMYDWACLYFGEPVSFQQACEYFDITIQGRHTAWGDALALTDLWTAIRGESKIQRGL